MVTIVRGTYQTCVKNHSGCFHEYCAQCCKKYVREKFLNGYAFIDCPHEDCQQHYSRTQYRRMLSKEKYKVLVQQQEEAKIPPSNRVYCLYKECSAFMEKLKSTGSSFIRCISCRRGFCHDCMVPWHTNKTCSEFRAQRKNSQVQGDEKLKQLAKVMKWKTCGACKGVVERIDGCDHMKRRCGNHFCYQCGGSMLQGHRCPNSRG